MRLKELRAKRKMSQADLAEASGVSREYTWPGWSWHSRIQESAQWKSSPRPLG